MQPEIPGHEPFKKIWREPQIVITREDIIDYEHSQKANQVQRSDVEKNKTKDECRTTPESLTDRLMDLRNSLLESHIVRQQLQTPKKYCNNTKDSDLVVQSNVSNTLSQDSDWAIPQYSMSKSVPSFPLIGAMPHMGVLPKIPSSQERCLSFLPDRLRLLEETRYVPETDEGDNSFWLSHRCCNSPRGKTVVYCLQKQLFYNTSSHKLHIATHWRRATCLLAHFVWNLIHSWYYGTYHIGDQRRLRRACASAQSRQSHRCSQYRSRRRVRPIIRHLAPPDGCACAFEEQIYPNISRLILI